MDDIGVSNDDMTVSFSLRRPSRAERSVDDPIREMEGMLVDEYGRCVICLFHQVIRLKAHVLFCLFPLLYVFLSRVTGHFCTISLSCCSPPKWGIFCSSCCCSLSYFNLGEIANVESFNVNRCSTKWNITSVSETLCL